MRLTCESAYVDLAASLDFDTYRAIAGAAYSVGEPLYQPLLYPERRELVAADLAKREVAESIRVMAKRSTWDETFSWLQRCLDAHLDAVADRLRDAQVVGLTTCFGQLFPNLVLAKRLKARNPGVVIVFGGSTASGRVGPGLLAEYSFIDHIVQGEGERPLVALLDMIAAGTPERPVPGVLSRLAKTDLEPAQLTEVPSMDDLPLPDFDEYAARADGHGLEWSLAVEGSRGCWWDRTKKSGSASATCYFCNLNVQWNGYREKSVDRVVNELVALSDRYGVLDVFFLDNIIRVRGTTELATRIRDLGKDFRIFYELRANLTQHDLFLLWEAGLREAQFGIEGLSTSYLGRIGKGTTVIQNLSAMKTCEELGIHNLANLITEFPGATEEEIDETVRNLERYAIAFRPLNAVGFGLGVESTVETLRERFGITNVRNAEFYQAGLPEDVFQRLQLMDLSFDCDKISASWAKVERACEAWRAKYGTGAPKLLMYQDAGSFLKIVDLRGDRSTSGTVSGLARDIYIYCCDVRTRKNVEQRFPGATAKDITDALESFIAEDLMFHEGGRYLSLAMAHDASAAARRIVAQAAEVKPRRALPTVSLN